MPWVHPTWRGLQVEQNSSPQGDALPGSPKTKGIQMKQASTSQQSNTHHMQEDVMKKRIS